MGGWSGLFLLRPAAGRRARGSESERARRRSTGLGSAFCAVSPRRALSGRSERRITCKASNALQHHLAVVELTAASASVRLLARAADHYAKPHYGPPETLCRPPGLVLRTAPTSILRNLAARWSGNRPGREAFPEFWPEAVCDALTINASSRETLPHPVQRLEIHRTA
jgi:hypothetical protein